MPRVNLFQKGHKGYWLGKKRPPFSEESRRKMSESHKGKKPYMVTDEIRKKMSEVAKRVGTGKWTKGRKRPLFSKEWRENMSKSMKGRKAWNKGIYGKYSHNWLGGKSFEPYSLDWTETLRISIRERDKYTCQLCREKQGDTAFSVHHINYNKKDCNPNNLITLCNSCHNKTNFKREYWVKYFSKKKYGNL